MERPLTHPYCTRKYQVPVWHKPFKPILPKEEREPPMLICRKPETLKYFDRQRIKQLATPKVSTINVYERYYNIFYSERPQNNTKSQ